VHTELPLLSVVVELMQRSAKQSRTHLFPEICRVQVCATLLIFCVLLSTSIQTATVRAGTIEYDLPDLTGEYYPALRSRTTYLTYQGGRARLERLQIYLTGYGSEGYCKERDGDDMWDEPVWLEITISKSEEPYFFSKDPGAIWHPPCEFTRGPTWYRWYYAGDSYPGSSGWTDEVILFPGDILTIRFSISCGSCGSYYYALTPGYATLYDFVFTMDLNESIVPVEQTSWGRIKAIYKDSQ
jgi:hypothetical protein